MTNDLTGRVAIVTGAGRGIGAAIALRLARAGADIVVNDIASGNAEEVGRQITAFGRKAITSSHDVSDHAAAIALAAEANGRMGRVDILVNNAGITRDALLNKLTEDQWDEVIRVNLKGPFNMGQACAKHMSAQKWGRIINISSVAWMGNVGQTNYSASKAGVVGLTRTWALELARFNINVNAIAPGFIESALTQKIPAEIKDRFIQRIPLRRIGNPEEIAELAAFLAGPGASYITGQIIHADGGLGAGIGGA